MIAHGSSTARQALSLFVENDEFPNNVASAAGIAVEVVMKGCLIARSPILVLDSRPTDDALKALAGLREFGPAVDFPTVTFAEAARRMSWVWPNFPYSAASDKVIVVNRNAAVHAGLVDVDDAARSMAIMVRLIEWMHENSVPAAGARTRERSPYEMWTPYEDVARRLAEDDKDSARMRAIGKIADARREFSRRYSTLTPLQMKALFPSLTNAKGKNSSLSEGGYSYYITHEECPACGNTGWLLHGSEIAAVDADEASNVGVKRVAHPEEFDCPICGLTLWAQEVSAVGFTRSIDLGWAESDPN
jgi:hypothetical protein